MNWFNMGLQVTLCCSFIFTLITSILDFLMDWFKMGLQTTLCFSFIHIDYKYAWLSHGLIQNGSWDNYSWDTWERIERESLSNLVKKKRSVVTFESGEKRKEECSDGGKDQSQENPRDPRRKGRLETNYQFYHYQSLYSGNINMQYNQNSTV